MQTNMQYQQPLICSHLNWSVTRLLFQCLVFILCTLEILMFATRKWLELKQLVLYSVINIWLILFLLYFDIYDLASDCYKFFECKIAS